MKNPRFITILAWINVVLIALLFTDTFGTDTYVECETFTESSHKTGVKSKNGSRKTTYYVHTTSGHRYNVPQEVYLALSAERTSFCIYKSGLLGRNLFIAYYIDGKEYKVKTGFLNETAFGVLLGIVIFIFSLPNMTAKPLLISPPYTYGMVFCASLSVIIMLVCYFSVY